MFTGHRIINARHVSTLPQRLDTLLEQLIAHGYTEFWELAERFGVTEEFAKKAVCYYVHGNLASELYF